jgi:hypothetical protein
MKPLLSGDSDSGERKGRVGRDHAHMVRISTRGRAKPRRFLLVAPLFSDASRTSACDIAALNGQ